MKKKAITKYFAMAMAMALAVVAAPVAGSPITAKASSDVDDGCVRGDESTNPSTGNANFEIEDDDVITEELGRQEAATFNTGSSTGSTDNGGASSDTSYSDGNSISPVNDSTGSDDAGSTGSVITGSGLASASVSAGLVRNGSLVCVPGYEPWRQEADAAAGTFKVFHCGILQYTAQLKDADGSAASCRGMEIIQSEDGGWYLNFVTDGGTDTTGWTAGTAKGTVSYLPKLGISGVCINGTAVVGAEG